MRTLTVKKNSGNWATGWHELTVSSSKYGTLNGGQFLEIGFVGYPENFTLRIYAKKGTSGEEFAIGNTFRYANAGIMEGLEGDDGNKVIKIDDAAESMIGNKLNIFFYKDGEYTRCYSSVAPTVFKNAIDDFTEDDVNFHKKKAEDRFKNYTPKGSGSTDTIVSDTTTTPEVTDEVEATLPF